MAISRKNGPGDSILLCNFAFSSNAFISRMLSTALPRRCGRDARLAEAWASTPHPATVAVPFVADLVEAVAARARDIGRIVTSGWLGRRRVDDLGHAQSFVGRRRAWLGRWGHV